jgi:integrase
LALAIVARRLAAAGESPFVFASPNNHAQSIISQAPTRAVYRAGRAGRILPLPAQATPEEREEIWRAEGFTPHDLRRTCRTFWAKIGVEETVAKKILGHVPPRSDVTASVYDQHTYLPEMHRALERWEAKLLAIVNADGQGMEVAA